MNYLLFAGNQYYPQCGVLDLRGEYLTPDEALAAAASGGWDWYQVVDRVTMRVVTAHPPWAGPD